MSEQSTPELPEGQKPKKKGIPTWIWFVSTFAIVSMLGNVLFGGNTWITIVGNFVSNTISSITAGNQKDTSKDDFCLTGEITQIDKDNTIAVVTEADNLVQTTTGAIGYASLTDDPLELEKALQTVKESGENYLLVGKRLLTATNCGDTTYEYLMKDFGDSMVLMSENFEQWDAISLLENPILLAAATPLIEQAAGRAQAILSYVENLG
jgi:hypothetical protein